MKKVCYNVIVQNYTKNGVIINGRRYGVNKILGETLV